MNFIPFYYIFLSSFFLTTTRSSLFLLALTLMINIYNNFCALHTFSRSFQSKMLLYIVDVCSLMFLRGIRIAITFNVNAKCPLNLLILVLFLLLLFSCIDDASFLKRVWKTYKLLLLLFSTSYSSKS